MLLSSIYAPFARNATRDVSNTSSYWGQSLDSLAYGWPEEDSIKKQYYFNSTCYDEPCEVYNPQLRVQTTSKSQVCELGNSTFDVYFEFINGKKNTVQYSTNNFKPMERPKLRSMAFADDEASYELIFHALVNVISGNSMTTIYETDKDIPRTTGVASMYYEKLLRSQIMETDLAFCEELANSYWNDNQIGLSSIGRIGVVPWQQAPNYTDADNSWQSADIKSIKRLPQYENTEKRCRNSTLC